MKFQKLIFSLTAATLLNTVASGAGIQFQKGNGVIVDDVSQDIICSSDNTCSSALLNTLASNYNVKPGQTFYILPDFMSITQMPASGLKTVYDNCENYGLTNPNTGKALYNAMNYVLNYSSLPIVNFDLLTTDNTINSKAKRVLGGCVKGESVTKLYANPNSNGQAVNKVLPLISGDAYLINSLANDVVKKSSKSAQSQQTLMTLAADIATTINNDPYANGVSFDLEGPSLSANGTKVFIGYLAPLLAKNNKLVAIYDANKGALSSPDLSLNQSLLNQLTPLSSKFSNVIVLASLYGIKGYTQPPSPSDYQTYTTDSVVKAYIQATDIPVLFVAPGSATDMLYEYSETYNEEGNFTSCSPFDDNTTTVLTAILTDAYTPTDFLKNCNNSVNSEVTSQEQYFTAALNSITDGYNLALSHKGDVIGTVLYDQRPQGMSAIDCAKNNFNYRFKYTPKSVKQCTGVYPEVIIDNIWQKLQSWTIPGSGNDQE